MTDCTPETRWFSQQIYCAVHGRAAGWPCTYVADLLAAESAAIEAAEFAAEFQDILPYDEAVKIWRKNMTEALGADYQTDVQRWETIQRDPPPRLAESVVDAEAGRVTEHELIDPDNFEYTDRMNTPPRLPRFLQRMTTEEIRRVIHIPPEEFELEKAAMLAAAEKFQADELVKMRTVLDRVTELFERWASEESTHRVAGEYGIAEGINIAINDLREAVHPTEKAGTE